MRKERLDTLLRWSFSGENLPWEDVVYFFFRAARKWHTGHEFADEWDEDILRLCVERYQWLSTVPEYVSAYCEEKIYPERIIHSANGALKNSNLA